MRQRIRRKKTEPKQPTVEEVREQFAEAGMPADEWKDRPEGPLGVPPLLEKSRENLKHIKAHLEQQVAADQKAVAIACEELARLEHGGAAAGGR